MKHKVCLYLIMLCCLSLAFTLNPGSVSADSDEAVMLDLHKIARSPWTEMVVASSDPDNDGDGRPASVDCDDNNPLWHDICELKAYTGCTNENRFLDQCLPNVSNVEVTLNTLREDLVGMKKDKHTWKYARVRPGDNLQFPYEDPLYYASKRHVQSIQYIDITSSDRYIVTSLSDEHTNKAAIQLIKTSGFGSEKKGEGKDFTTDKIVYQRLLTDDDEVAGFNHPGGHS